MDTKFTPRGSDSGKPNRVNRCLHVFIKILTFGAAGEWYCKKKRSIWLLVSCMLVHKKTTEPSFTLLVADVLFYCDKSTLSAFKKGHINQVTTQRSAGHPGCVGLLGQL